MPGSATSSDRQLAVAISEDKNLATVYAMARRLLGSGLTGGSIYPEIWIRDSNTFIEVALKSNNPRIFRQALLNYVIFQGEAGDKVPFGRGSIVDLYAPTGTPGTEDWDAPYKSEHMPGITAFKSRQESDGESSLVSATRKYVDVTGDRSFLDEKVRGVSVRERLGLALDFVLRERLDASRGLIWNETTIDWGDVSPDGSRAVKNRAVCIYSNAMAVIAIGDYLQLTASDTAESKRWNARRDELKRNIRKHLWDDKRGKFIPHLYLDSSPFPSGFNEGEIYYHGGTAVAIEAGLLSRNEAVQALQRMRENVKAAGASSIGMTIYPPYPSSVYKSQEPYTYQDGGDWCWFGGRMVQQLVRLGMVEDAYREIAPMVTRVVKAGDFHEWWTRDNQPRGSAAFKGSAGVLGKAIEMLQAWAARTLSA
ncbi:MAG: hypothetical protein P4K94_04695 [Terracidiphilus sp.]|nr:hypothetical protein [Terracidiphilus sp.]